MSIEFGTPHQCFTITNPGKFERERCWAPIFYEMGLDGMADDDEDGTWVFDLKHDDDLKTVHSDLKDAKEVRISVDDQGFVWGTVS